MKAYQSLCVALAAGLVPVSSPGQPTSSTYNNLEKADAVIGLVITDSHHQKVGKVKDLAVDLQAGRIAEVIIDTGGYLTTHSRLAAIPPQTLEFNSGSDGLRMTADLDAFDGAPVFDLAHWSDATTPGGITDVYKRFHVAAYKGMGVVESGSKLSGLTARNSKNEKVGKVECLVIDLPSGRMPELVLTSGEDSSAIPAQAFVYSAEGNVLLIEASKLVLDQVPHFKAAEWRTGVNQSLAVSDKNRQLQNPTARPVVTGDESISFEIERRILLTDGLSIDAHHVTVNTQDGRVTLRGLCNSEVEKRQLGQIAAGVVSPDHVSNQVEVRVLADANL